jgi:hypothetical protein
MISFGRGIENVQYLDFVRRFQRNPVAGFSLYESRDFR